MKRKRPFHLATAQIAGKVILPAAWAGRFGPPVERRDDLVGRPSSEALVKDEWRRRRAEGLLEPMVKQQATQLADWLRNTHPEAPPMKASTIENKIPRWR